MITSINSIGYGWLQLRWWPQLLILLVMIFTNLAAAQSPLSPPAPPPAQLVYQPLLDLSFPFTVLAIAAHPDDEDSDTLAYYRTKYGARTVIVLGTRGEGGQNSQGPELYAALGIRRIQEMTAAANKLQAITFNLGLPEPGFSKSVNATFQLWQRPEALRRLVYALRLFRPDIIITNHERDTGHAHHQAMRLLTEEAIVQAANPQNFPLQLQNGLATWQVKRFFARTVNNQQYDTEFDTNATDPVYKHQYSQLGYQSRQEHRTQGPWLAPAFTGERMLRYNLVLNKEGEFRRWYYLHQNLIPHPIYQKVQALVFAAPATSAQLAAQLPPLVLASRLIQAINLVTQLQETELVPDPQFAEITEKLHRALLALQPVTLHLAPSLTQLPVGGELQLQATITSTQPVTLSPVRLATPDDWAVTALTKAATSLTAGATTKAEFNLKILETAAPDLTNPDYFAAATFGQPQIVAQVGVTFPGLLRPIIVSQTTRLEVAPQLIMQVTPAQLPLNIANGQITNTAIAQVTVINNSNQPLTARLRARGLPPIRITPDDQQFLIAARSQAVLSCFLEIGRPITAGKILIPIVLTDNYGQELLTQPLEIALIDVQINPKLRVGYLRSFDFTLAQALEFLGVNQQALTLEAIAAGNLANHYDTIILDSRAYLAYPGLAQINDRLLQFVREGGNLVVLGQRPIDWNSQQFAPYPIKLSAQRVSERDAAVNFLLPAHPLLNRPNQITAKDFDNWVQERGLNFPETWDERYQMLLASADSGEPLLTGGLLVAHHGRGYYIYTSYALARQLRNRHSGAYRLLANLLSGKNP
jgi:LmbE family N-acetylglucosaminyl deacetylase